MRGEESLVVSWVVGDVERGEQRREQRGGGGVYSSRGRRWRRIAAGSYIFSFASDCLKKRGKKVDEAVENE